MIQSNEDTNRTESRVLGRLIPGRLASDLGTHPAGLASGVHPLLAGIDGRTLGCYRRYQGHAVLLNGLTSDGIGSGGTTTGVHPRTNWWNRLSGTTSIDTSSGTATLGTINGIKEVWPFSLPQRNDPSGRHVYGFVAQDDTFGLAHIFYWVEGSGTERWRYDLVRQPVYPTTNYSASGSNYPVFWNTTPSVSGTSGGITPLCVAQNGPYLYLGANGTQTFPLTLWFDRSATSGTTAVGWDNLVEAMPFVTSNFGVSRTDLPVTISSGTVQSGLSAPVGRCALGYRLYNPSRGLVTNMSQPYEASASQSIPAAFLVALDFSGTAATTASRDYHRETFPFYQFFSTLSSQSATTVAGGGMYLHDTMQPTSAWTAGTSNEFTQTLGFALTRSENTSHGAPDWISVPDESLVLSYKWTPTEDEFLTPLIWYDVATYQGLTFVLASDPDISGDSTTKAGFLTLYWSTTKVPGQENFPLTNYQSTEYRATSRGVRMVHVSDFLYIFGDGPVTRVRRNGTAIEIETILQGLKLLNRNAVLPLGDSVIIGTDNGFWQLDGATGSPVRLSVLDRVLRDRWLVGTDTISMAYDAEVEAIFIHNALVSETVVMWLSTNVVTWLYNNPAIQVVTARMPVDGTIRQKAIFVTPRGHFTYPQLRASSTISHTMRGLPFQNYGWNMTAGTSSGVAHLGGTSTLCPLFDAAGATASFYGYDISDCAAYVRSGPLAGSTFRCHATDLSATASATSHVILRTGGELNLSSAEISIAPIRSLIIGSVLGDPVSGISLNQTRTTDAQMLHFSRLGGRALQDRDFPDGTQGTFSCGVTDFEGLLGTEPLTEAPAFYLTQLISSGTNHTTMAACPEGSSVSVTRPNLNVGYALRGGHALFPVVQCDVSDLDWDLIEAEFSGTIGATTVAYGD